MSVPFASIQAEATESPVLSLAGALHDAWAALEHVPGALLALDAAGSVVFANGIAELRLDQARGELLGRNLFSEILPELGASGAASRYLEAFAAGRVALSLDATVGTSRGPVPLTLGIRGWEAAGARHALVLVEDRAALALERSRRRQAERMAAIGELATGVAHEVNNPLATIKSFAQLLGADANTPELVRGLEIVSAECTRISRVLHDLLGFASQQFRPTREAVDLSTMVDRVVALKAYALATAGVTIERDLDPSPTPVEVGVDVLQRVVLCLLTHAERELQRCEGERRLTVRTRESTHGVTLSMIDSGPGIPRAQLPTLLHAPRSLESPDPLGLDVAADLVREQGGQMWVDSVPGRGTAVFARFLRPSDEPPLPVPTRWTST